MTSEPRAFLTQDTGAATIAAALVGRVGGRWRLIGSLAVPAGADPTALAALLVERVSAVDPVLAAALGLDRTPVEELPRVEVASHPPRRLAVVAGSERALVPLVAAASRSGWRTSSASAETADPLEMSTLLLDPGVNGILAGAGDPPAADERRALGELGALVAAAAHRRPEVPIVLAGGMAGQLHAFGDVADRPARLLIGSAARLGRDGAGLRELLTDAALPPDDARRALGAAAVALAEVLDRRIDVVEIGFDGGTRAGAWPGAWSEAAAMDLAIVPSAGLAPADPDDQVVDRVATWSTSTTDRHRLRDRMRELRIAPWADATGEGVALRLAAARAALSCLARWTPEWADRPAADLVVATGGTWAVASGPSVALALVDVLRRAGAAQFALDHGRLLAPLGSIPDAGERRAILADLADDLLAPLGTVVTPGGLRHGRSVGALQLHGASGRREHELRPGGLELVELPPGATAVAEFRFHDTVRLGGRGRHFTIDVTGGLGGLVVDLRDVPLRLPERADLRGELLEAWQSAVRTGRDA
ncbi:MAG: hypothetical protein Q7S35_06540 [Candidatus Limnocylindrales bacterium]|nr:hypothetical protein [Candidatus Limnocylindrales bacterium]